MFESTALKQARATAKGKYRLYRELRKITYSLATTYINIRRTVDKDCHQDQMDNIFSYYIIDQKYSSEYAEYNMPLILDDGSYLTMNNPLGKSCERGFWGSDLPESIYINNLLVFSRLPYGHDQTKYATCAERSVQLRYEEKIQEYNKAILENESYLYDLKHELDQTHFFQNKRKAAIKTMMEPFLINIQGLREAIEKTEAEAKPYYEQCISYEEVLTYIKDTYGLTSRPKPKRFSVPKQDDPMKLVKKGFASENDEIAYLERFSMALDQEIEKLRSYVLQPDDPYIAYEAFQNGIAPEEVPQRCKNRVQIYRMWLYEAYPVYFQKKMREAESDQRSYAETDKQFARLFANLTSFGTYHVSKDVVTSSDGMEGIMAEKMAKKYQKIDVQMNQNIDEAVQKVVDKWNWLGMKRYQL